MLLNKEELFRTQFLHFHKVIDLGFSIDLQIYYLQHLSLCLI